MVRRRPAPWTTHPTTEAAPHDRRRFAISKLAPTATFERRYDSRPGEGLGKTDTQLVTGVPLRFD